MASKKEKLILIDLRNINAAYPKEQFRVKKVINTTRFKIDQYLSLKEVDDEIAYNKEMTVEIISK